MNQEIPIATPTPKPTLKEWLLAFWTKFYSNKKIFWPIASLFSLMILVTIAGIIFRLVGGKKVNTTQIPTPTPVVEIPETEEQKEPLDLAKEELQKLEIEIKNLDIKQQRLTPPTVDFKVDF